MSRMMRYLGTLLVVLISMQALHGQSDPDREYLIGDHMKVAPENEDAYIELELGPWKKIHQARLDAGLITGWYFYRVRFPAGKNAWHNYVTITLYKDFEALDKGWDFPIAGIDMDMDKLFEKTLKLRDLVCSDAWVTVDFISNDNPSKYARVNYMKPKNGMGNYIETELEVWKPLHQTLVDSGKKSGWGVYVKTLPSGTSLPFNAAAVDFYDSFAALGAGFGMKDIEAAHPGVTEEGWDAMMDRTMESRDAVLSEVWELVDSVAAEGD